MGKTLTEHLQKLKDQQQGIFVPYIMAGDHEKGLAGLQERVEILGGYFEVQSAPGKGTLVRALLPLAAPAVDEEVV